ncbi:MAG: 16S rRNA (cytidine(1402)-2'-O)-methyltransferase [Bradymonadaceae bacterium]
MLTICPTPIGNLDDVTPRQREALRTADVVACEDTRRTGKLYERLGMPREDGEPRLVSYRDENELEAAERLGPALEAGLRVVLVSDAGTPGLSDPGYRLVRIAHEVGASIESLPGPFAAAVALVASGLPTDSFQFLGFLPSDDRRGRLRRADERGLTAVVYESPHRLVDLLDVIEDVCGADRTVCVAREMTKMHEEYRRGSVTDVRAEFVAEEGEPKGECCVVVDAAADTGAGASEAEIDEKIRELLDRGLTPRSIREILPELFDVSRSSVYDRIESVREGGEQAED